MRDYNILIFKFKCMPHYSDIPHSNPDVDRAFNTLLSALEELAPGIRADLKFVLDHCSSVDRDKTAESDENVDIYWDLPSEEIGGFRAIMEHATRLFDAAPGDLEDKKFALFPNARLLRVRYGDGLFCEMTVHANRDPHNTIGRDLFSVGVRDHDERTDTNMTREMDSSRYVHPSRAGTAQPSFAEALRSSSDLALEIGAFAAAIQMFRSRVESKVC